MKLRPYRKPQMPRRNDRCPCGSGKKAKRCCLPAIQSLTALPPRLREQAVVAQILRRPPLLAAEPITIQVEGGTVTTEDGISVPIEAGSVVVSTLDDSTLNPTVFDASIPPTL